MTYAEKARKEHPEEISQEEEGGFFCCLHYLYHDVDIPDYCRIGEWSTSENCHACWNREIPETNLVVGDSEVEHPDTDIPHILDSGNRREFASGAVRDIQEGKGRCDLLPLDVVGQALGDEIVKSIHSFVNSGDERLLYCTLNLFNEKLGCDKYTMLLEVSIHFEEGAKKYGDNNWQKGIPVRCYIDSAVRHYLKFLRGDKDEPHDRAFVWNILCAIWTCKHMPELNEYGKEKGDV